MSEKLYNCPHCGKELNEHAAFNGICPACHKGFDVANLHPKPSLPTYEQPKQLQPVVAHIVPNNQFFPSDMLQSGEKVVFSCHPNKLYFLLPLAVVSFWGVILIFATPFGWLVFLGGTAALFFRFLQWRNTIYGFTNKRLLKHSGIFSKEFYATQLKRVQDTRVTIEWVKSFFNCGDIAITTAGTAGVECTWESISEPRGVEKLLNSYLEQKEDNSP